MGSFRHLLRQKVAERFGTRDGVVFSTRVPFLKHLRDFIPHIGKNVFFPETSRE